MIPLATLNCLKCRGMAYLEDGTDGQGIDLACMNCGAFLARIRLPEDDRLYVPNSSQQYDPELKAICLEWLRDGEAVADVEYASQVHRTILEEWRMDAQIGPRPQYSPAFKSAIVARLRAGETQQAVYRETGVDAGSMRKWLQKEAGG